MNKLKVLLETKLILLVFLVINLMGILWSIVTGETGGSNTMPQKQFLIIKSVSFLIYSLLAFFVLKNIKVAVWLMAAVLIITGAGTTLLGLVSVGFNQYFVKTYFIIAGLYFLIGGIYLPKNRAKMES